MKFTDLWNESRTFPWHSKSHHFREILLNHPTQYVEWLRNIVKEKASSRVVTFYQPKLVIEALKEWDGTLISLHRLDMDPYVSSIKFCWSDEYSQAYDTRALLHATFSARKAEVWPMSLTQDQIRELLASL